MDKLSLNTKDNVSKLLEMNSYKYSTYAKFNSETLFYDVDTIIFDNSHLNIKKEFEFLNSNILIDSSNYEFKSSYYDCCTKFKNNIIEIAKKFIKYI